MQNQSGRRNTYPQSKHQEDGMGGHALHYGALTRPNQTGSNRGHGNLKAEKQTEYPHGHREGQTECRQFFGSKHRDIKCVDQLEADDGKNAPCHG